MSDSPLKIALTGITGYANSYLHAIDETPSELGTLKAVTAINRNEEEARCLELESNGVDVYTDFDSMIEAYKGKIDLSILPVPIHLHLPMTLASQAAGMHVMLEKPLAGSVEQGLEICEAAKGPTRIAVGFQDMYRPSTHEISRQLCEERIGKITGINVLVLWPRGNSYYTRNHWAGAVEADGHVVRDSPINNATAHFVNLALYFAGISSGKMAKAEKVEAELFRVRDISSFDTAAIRIQSNTGVPMHVYATHSCLNNETATVTVNGEKGSMTWVQGKYVEWNVEGQTETVEIETMFETKMAMWISVLNSIKDGSEFCCTPEMAMSHIELVEKLHAGIEIRDISEKWLKTIERDGDINIYLPEMDTDLKRCLKAGALPSELGCKWAV
ncbi:Gfo/Idh/MocA family oxidoreductase [Kiritimatiellaeota bacterium B1221]|nr:Gfo/Idh/MocA family oxidoreductase [Kiritimatiellaeota bacterium B1221]